MDPQISYDDFTYAIQNDSPTLSAEKKQLLLDMAHFMKEDLGKENLKEKDEEKT